MNVLILINGQELGKSAEEGVESFMISSFCFTFSSKEDYIESNRINLENNNENKLNRKMISGGNSHKESQRDLQFELNFCLHFKCNFSLYLLKSRDFI